jgi:hypothetical protein
MSNSRASFELYVTSQYGIDVRHNRLITQPGYSATLGVGGCAKIDERTAYFTQDCADVTAIAAIAHEVGHLLESDDNGADLYSWRAQVDLYELECEAWDRAASVLIEWPNCPNGVATEFVTLKDEALKSYAAHVMSAEYIAQQTKLLEGQNG